MTEYRIGFITVPRVSAAKKISMEIVRRRLAACVNIMPGIQSVYHWNRKIQKSNEVLLILKTRKTLVKKIISVVEKIHPYDVPEIIFFTIDEGNKSYLQWLSKESR